MSKLLAIARRAKSPAAGLRSALTPEWRGGVLCRVLEGARLRAGAPVSLEPAITERAKE